MKRLLAVFAILFVAGSIWVWQDLYRPFRGYSGNLILQIEPGSRAPEVAGLLVARGVLAHRLPFLFRYFLGRPRHRIKAGEYLFDRPLRPIDVYRKLIQGDVYLRMVVIPEGSNRFDIARICQAQLGLNPEEFLRVTERASAIHDLDPEARTLEGYLFPDTYRFSYSTNSAGVAAAMLARFRRVLESKFPREVRQTPARLHEVITLASLIEKETPDASERPIVAGVFLNRLRKRWPLQCDPTVVYAARLIGRPIGPISKGDLNLKLPYNTYRMPGLPPGPICSPGEVSIRAALNPAPVNFLYFVSNNQGGHIFARTLAEHQRNVARYRKQRAALRRSSPEVKSHAP